MGTRALLVAMALLVAPSPVPAQEEATEKAAELERLRERIGALRESLERDLSRQDRARDELRRVEQSVAEQAAGLRALDKRIVAGERRLVALRAERVDHEHRIAGEREALAGQLRAAYALGRQERVKLLLNQEDPAAVGRVLVYYDHFNRARLARIERIAGLMESLSDVVANISAETETLGAERDRSRALLASLERTREQRSTVVTRIENEIRAGGDRLERLEADEKRLVRLLESLADLLADVPAELGAGEPFERLRGRLDWPVTGATVAARARGMLFAAPAGREVKAVGYGRVAWAGWMPHYGNLMVVEHDDGYYSLYGHNQALLRAVGEWVHAGDVIALVGDSGGQGQTGLYFELRKGRTPVDARRWLVKR